MLYTVLVKGSVFKIRSKTNWDEVKAVHKVNGHHYTLNNHTVPHLQQISTHAVSTIPILKIFNVTST